MIHSTLTTRIERCLAESRGRLSPWRRAGLSGPLGVCLHTTGLGVVRRAEREKTTPLDAAIKVYCKIMEPGPHYVVGYNGEIVSVCDEALIAWHAGISTREATRYRTISRQYAHESWYQWWVDRWGAAGPDNNPLRLLESGRDRTGNACLGVEILASPRDEWPDAQIAAVSALVKDLEERHDGMVGVFQHSDFAPYTRVTKTGKSWDLPENFPWEKLA